MSGLYNLVLGDGREAERFTILCSAVLGLTPTDVGRYRDCWVEWDDQELRIAVYTRNGGGNRTDLAQEIEALRDHPLFIADKDDDFDTTYATFYFHVPERIEQWTGVMVLNPEDWDQLRQTLEENAFEEPVDMSKRWQDAIFAARAEDQRRANERSNEGE